MRILATKSGNNVVIVGFLYHGKDEAAVLKAVYVDANGVVSADTATSFTVTDKDFISIYPAPVGGMYIRKE